MSIIILNVCIEAVKWTSNHNVNNLLQLNYNGIKRVLEYCAYQLLNINTNLFLLNLANK